MKTNIGDFVIVCNPKNKMIPVWVTKGDEAGFTGEIDNKDRALAETVEELSFEKADVFANLGKNPKGGAVYGLQIEPWKKVKQIRPWTTVNVYADLNETDEKALFTALKTTGGVLQQRGLIAPKPIDVEIRPPKGKYAGTYRFKPKEDAHDVMTLRPKDFADLPYIIYHESGHHVWFNLVNTEQKNLWTETFIKSSVLREVTKNDLNEYKQTLKDSGNCKTFIAKCEDEDEHLVVAEIFKYIQSRHHIDKRVINELLAAEKFDQIDAIFPNRTSFVGKKEPLVSDYGTKAVEELFAEAFAFKFVDKELPKAIRILLKQTFKELGV